MWHDWYDQDGTSGEQDQNIVSLHICSGCSARSVMQRSTRETKTVFTNNWVWVSRFFCTWSKSSTAAAAVGWVESNVAGPGRRVRPRLCHRDWRVLLRAGFLRGEQQLSLVKVNRGGWGGCLAGVQQEIWARKLEICNPTCVSEPGVKRSV